MFSEQSDMEIFVPGNPDQSHVFVY